MSYENYIDDEAVGGESASCLFAMLRQAGLHTCTDTYRQTRAPGVHPNFSVRSLIFLGKIPVNLSAGRSHAELHALLYVKTYQKAISCRYPNHIASKPQLSFVRSASSCSLWS